MRLIGTGALLLAFSTTGLFGAGCGSGSEAAADHLPDAPLFDLMINGENVGNIRSISGGAIKAEVITEPTEPPSHYVKKHLATITYEPIFIEVGLTSAPGIYQWIQATLRGEAPTRSGVIHASDFKHEVMAGVEFENALITEFKFPALDGSSKEPAYMTLKIDPEDVKYMTMSDPPAAPQPEGKMWLSSNFKCEIGSLPCERVSKIDSFRVTQISEIVPAKIEIPNLKFTISTADVDPWTEWHKSFVIDGQATDANEVSGSITFLAPDRTTELGRIDLQNVGIFSLELNKDGAAPEATFTAGLYVEQMTFSHPSSR